MDHTGDITQLFVDDEPMVNARWPNAQFYDDSIFSHSTWAEGDENSISNTSDPDYVDDRSVNGSLQIDEDVHNPGSLDLNGSIGILNIGSFKTWTVEITGHTQNAGSDDMITYNTGDIGTYKDKHHYYFFEGKLDFMDTNKRVGRNFWKTLPSSLQYIYSPDSTDVRANGNRTNRGLI